METIEFFLLIAKDLLQLEYLLIYYPHAFMFSPRLIKMFDHPTIKQIRLMVNGCDEWRCAWVERVPSYEYTANYHTRSNGCEVNVLYDIEKKRDLKKFFPLRATLNQLINDMFEPGFGGWKFQ